MYPEVKGKQIDQTQEYIEIKCQFIFKPPLRLLDWLINFIIK